jgi:transketolase
VAVERTDGPTALVLSRQGLPVLDETVDRAREGVAQGAYVLAESGDGRADLTLVATGSEVSLILAAREKLAADGITSRVVAMPSWELFDRQPDDVRARVLPRDMPTLAVEAGVSRGWRDYVGESGAVHAIDRFGASAPGRVVAEQYGLTPEEVARRARELLEG